MRRTMLAMCLVVCALVLAASVSLPKQLLRGVTAWAAPQDETKPQNVRRKKDDREQDFMRGRLVVGKQPPHDIYDKGLEQWNRLPRVTPPKGAGNKKDEMRTATTSLTGTVWKPIGPSPIIQGSSMVNGRVSSIAVNPTNPNIVYQGSSGGGVWRTNNAMDPMGANWTPLFDQQPSLGTGEPSAIGIDPNNTNTIYVGTSGRFVQNISKGIMKSTDGGSSWISLGSGFPAGNSGNACVDPTNFSCLFTGQFINVIIVDPANSNTLYLAASNGLFRSTNGGLDWTAGTNGFGDARSLVLDTTTPAGNRILYAGLSGRGVFQSINGGQTWTQRLSATTTAVAAALPAGGGIGQVLVDLAPPTSPANPNGIQVLYTSMQGTGMGANDPVGLFRSTNQGGTWNRQSSTGIPTGTQGGYSFSMSVDPASPGDGVNDIIYLGAVGAGRSNDSGNNFSGVGPGIHADSHSNWVFVRQPSPAQSIVFTGNDGGIWKSTDGGATWSGTGGPAPTINGGGLQTALIYNIDVLKDATASVTLAALQDNGVVRLTGVPAGNDTIGGDGFSVAFDPNNPSTAYMTSGFFSQGSCPNPPVVPCSIMFQSTTSGSSWINASACSGWFSANVPVSEQDCVTAVPGTHPVKVDPTDGNYVYYGGAQDLWQTTNGMGSSFRKISNGFGRPNTLDIAPGNANNVVVGFNGQVWLSTNAKASTVGPPTGVTFTNITRNLTAPNVTRIAFDPNDSTVIYATVGGFSGNSNAHSAQHVFRTTTGGATWTDISPAIDIPFQALALDGTASPTAIYVGNDLGVMRSVDSGATWAVLDDVHLPNVPVTDLAINTQAGVLRAGTFGRGVFELAAPTGPVIAVNAQNGLQFDNICVGSSADLSLQVFNVGTQNLRIDSVDRIFGSTDFTVQASPATPFTLLPGASVTFTVRFTPTTSNPQKATIRITSNDPTVPFFDLMAMGTSGSAVIATAIADSGNFGDVCVGKFADMPLTVDNRGNCDLRITAIASSSPEFLIPGVVIFPLVVRPGDSIQLPLRFRPTSFGAKSATFKITSNDPANMSMQTVSVSGNAPSATIVVPTMIQFDNTCPGNTNIKTLTIGNSGGCDLIVTGITSSSLEFKVVGIVPFPLVIPPGSTRDVPIQFMPMGFNINPVHMAILTIFSNDLNNPIVMVTVKGTVPPPIIQVIPDPLDFGKVCLGTFKDLPLTIKNTGDCNLTVSNITSNSPEFTLPALPPLPFVIPPGGMRDVIVRFTPSSTGMKSGKITITSDDPATPMKMVTVKGIAPVSDIGVSGPTDFGTVMVGSSRQQVLNIFNTEPCDLLITLVCEVNSTGIIVPSTDFNLATVLPYPVLIPGGGTLPVTIRFSPDRKGPRTANLIVCGYDPKTPGPPPPPGACPMFSNILHVVPLTGKGK